MMITMIPLGERILAIKASQRQETGAQSGLSSLFIFYDYIMCLKLPCTNPKSWRMNAAQTKVESRLGLIIGSCIS